MSHPNPTFDCENALKEDIEDSEVCSICFGTGEMSDYDGQPTPCVHVIIRQNLEDAEARGDESRGN